ncbi:MAG TPA: VWA domain-containing protein, partial [Anaerolineales bacterium]|nr:VWA domain-containing protein [Anaerolineales bacterium]
LAAALRTRIALRQKRAKSGQLDPKSTIRSNLKYHGVPMEIKYRDRTRKPKIVVICDVSTSMRFCSELMLSFLFALQGQISKTYAFAFIDHLESISEDFRGSDADEAVSSVLLRMPSGHYNTDLGWSLDNFNNEYLNTLNGQTTLIVVGDGRNNYNDPRVDIFSLMTRRAARTIWLNPEPPLMWHGDSDMPKYAPLCNNVLKVGNLKELVSAVDQLLSA